MSIGNIVGTLFANWLASVFYLLFHSLYDIKVEGLSNYTASASTIITINHKRDLDIPIIASILHLHRTVFKNKLRMHFIARDDLFYPGFLTAHFPFPGLPGRLIHHVNISPVMKALRAHPIHHLVRKRIGSLMREIVQLGGDIQLKHVVKPVGIQYFAELSGRKADAFAGITVKEFLGHSFCRLQQQTTDIGIIPGELSRVLRERMLASINRQLKVFTRILDEGGICLLAPEGQLSPDGRFWPVKSGLHRLVSMTHCDARVLPVNITYDFMARGRMKIYVTIGKEIRNLRGLGKIGLEREVQKSMGTLAPLTLGQLGSNFILGMANDGIESFEEAELHDILTAWIEKLKTTGIRLEDRITGEKALNNRIKGFISYCVKRGILHRKRNGTLSLNGHTVNDDMTGKFHSNPVCYSVNELKSLLELNGIN